MGNKQFDLKVKRKKKVLKVIVILSCGVCLCGRGWVHILWWFPGCGDLCLCSGWWSWISSLWRAVQCIIVGFGVSMNSVWLWTVLLALAVLDMPPWSGPLGISSLLPASYLSLESLLKLLFSHPILCFRPKLFRQVLVWCFSQLPKPALCFTETCVDFPQHPEPALCTAEICMHLSKHSGSTLCPVSSACSSLGTLHLPSMPQGLWVPLSAPQTCLMCHRTSVCFSWQPEPAV